MQSLFTTLHHCETLAQCHSQMEARHIEAYTMVQDWGDNDMGMMEAAVNKMSRIVRHVSGSGNAFQGQVAVQHIIEVNLLLETSTLPDPGPLESPVALKTVTCWHLKPEQRSCPQCCSLCSTGTLILAILNRSNLPTSLYLLSPTGSALR